VDYSLQFAGTNYHHHYKCALDKNVAKKIEKSKCKVQNDTLKCKKTD